MSAETYDPKRVVVTFGITPIDGFADGDAITVTRNGPGTAVTVGIAGEWAFKESADQSGVVKLKLMATAGANKLLIALYQAGNLPLPISVTSLSTLEIEVGGKAKIMKPPDKGYSGDVPTREWSFVVGELTSI